MAQREYSLPVCPECGGSEWVMVCDVAGRAAYPMSAQGGYTIVDGSTDLYVVQELEVVCRQCGYEAEYTQDEAETEYVFIREES